MQSVEIECLNEPLSALAEELEEELAGYDGPVIPAEYLDAFQFVGATGYKCLAPRMSSLELAANAYDPDFRTSLNRHLVAELLSRFDLSAGICRLPESVSLLYPRELTRIFNQLTTLDSAHYRLEKDAFIKDLAILTHRLIPVGAEYVCPFSGVPVSLLFRRGASQFLRGLKVCIRAGGFRPYFELHAHVLALDDFHPQGWDDTYQRLAELLVLNPDFCGVTSSSWFLAPALQTISPRLAYLQDVPRAHGATLLFRATTGRAFPVPYRDRRRVGNYSLPVPTFPLSIPVFGPVPT